MFLVSVLLALVALKCYLKYSTGWCKSKVCLSGKTVIVTGANSGIGLEAAKDFATRGARVILACRDEKRAIEAKDLIINETNNHNIVIGLVNFASLQSVREFAKHIIATEDRLDILVNNAGVGSGKDKITNDGLQLCMQINYFGPVLLTLLLIDLLKKCSPSRVINVSSVLAKYAKLTPEKLNTFPGYYATYNNSKLGNILFTMKLAKLLRQSGVSVFSLHPGAIRTAIFRNFHGIKKAALSMVMPLFFKSPEEGAQTTLYAALEQGLEQYTGSHLEDCQVVNPYNVARNSELEQLIWEKTIKLLGCEEVADKLI